MRQRWAILIPPLLCGLLADLCLVILPFRPVGEAKLALLIVASIMGTAAAWELIQWQQQCRRGFIELRSLRVEGAERPAFIAPVPHHLSMVPFMLCMVLIGISLDLLIVP